MDLLLCRGDTIGAPIIGTSRACRGDTIGAPIIGASQAVLGLAIETEAEGVVTIATKIIITVVTVATQIITATVDSDTTK